MYVCPNNKDFKCPYALSDYSTLPCYASKEQCDSVIKELKGEFLMTDKIKDTNPKDAVGTKKVPFSVLPAPVLAEVGLALLEGARKYGRHNYRAVGVRTSVYYDACLRHLMAWWEGEDIDPDSGLSHVTKAIAGLMVLRDSMMKGNHKDDRPPKVNDGWVQQMNEEAKNIIERYLDAKEPYTQLNTKENTNEKN